MSLESAKRKMCQPKRISQPRLQGAFYYRWFLMQNWWFISLKNPNYPSSSFSRRPISCHRLQEVAINCNQFVNCNCFLQTQKSSWFHHSVWNKFINGLQNGINVTFFVTLSSSIIKNSNLNRNPFFNLSSESLNKVAES